MTTSNRQTLRNSRGREARSRQTSRSGTGVPVKAPTPATSANGRRELAEAAVDHATSDRRVERATQQIMVRTPLVISSMAKRGGIAAHVTSRLLEALPHAAHSASAARTTISRSLSTRHTRGKEKGRRGQEPATTAPCSTSITLATAGQRTTARSASTKCSRRSPSEPREPFNHGCRISRTSSLCRSSPVTRSTSLYRTRRCEESPRDRKPRRRNREINRDRAPGTQKA